MVFHPLKWTRIPTLPLNLLDTFTEAFGIRYHYVNIIVVVVGAGITNPGTGMGLCVAAFMVVLGFNLFRAHVGYLHLNRASLICSSFVCSSWGLTQIVLASCVRVLSTLYVADKLWWLSQCKYLSVWIGFL